MTTLKEVAQMAGVGIATASTILNTPEKAERFSDKTAERVREVARKLNYYPNHRARVFRGGKTMVVGVAIESSNELDLISQPYWSSLISGLHHGLLEHNYQLTLISPVGQESAAEIGFRYLRERRVDGVVLTSLPTPDDLRLYDWKSGPTLVVGHPNIKGLPHIWADDEEGVRIMIDQFIEHGHRQLLWFGPKNWFDGSADRRANAFAMYCMERGVQARMHRFPMLNSSHPDFCPYPIQCERSLKALFDSGDCQATALFCFNGETAFAAYKVLNTMGKRIPEDCSVAAFDSHIGKYLSPPLTTVQLQRLQTGEVAAKALLELMEQIRKGEEPRESVQRISPVVVKRESVATAG